MKTILLLATVLTNTAYSQILSSEKEIDQHRKERLKVWNQEAPDLLRQLTAHASEETYFNTLERAFLLRPIVAPVNSQQYQNLLIVQMQYVSEVAKLPEDAEVSSKTKLLRKFSEKFEKMEQEALSTALSKQSNMIPSGWSNYGYPSIYSNSLIFPHSTQLGYPMGFSINCHPSNNYKFCTSDKGERYKRIGDGDISSERLEKFVSPDKNDTHQPSQSNGQTE